MKKLIAIVSILLLSTQVFCQNIWYFGNKAGLDFSTPTPSPATGSQMVTNEGCAMAYDENNNLLFYTDGTTVWRANGSTMTDHFTQLSGNTSATQSAIIIPMPGLQCRKFLIFTVDAAENNLAKGLRYSVVDYTTNPNGVLDNNFINVPLLPFQLVAEKLTAIQNSDGSFWVLAHNFQNNNAADNTQLGGQFYAFHITNTTTLPLLVTPTISGVGSVYKQTAPSGPNSVYTMSQGQMKISPNHRTLAVAVSSGNDRQRSLVEIFDFNDVTGVVANPTTYSVATNLGTPYGVEFSPSSNYLYISYTYGGTTRQIHQINLALLPQTNTTLSNTPPAGVRNLLPANNNVPNYGLGALQLGPDGNIYCANGSSTQIHAIIQPNSNNASIQMSAIPVGNSPNTSGLGLPTLVQGNLVCSPAPSTACTLFDCCPPINITNLPDMFVHTPTGGLNSPYHLIFSPTADFSNQVQTYTNYIHALCPEIQTFSQTWRVHDAGTANDPINQFQPIPVNGISGNTDCWTDMSPNGGGIWHMNPAFGILPQDLVPGRWYRIEVGLWTFAGQRVESSIPADCASVSFYYRVDVRAGIRSAQISDGKKVVKKTTIQNTNIPSKK